MSQCILLRREMKMRVIKMVGSISECVNFKLLEEILGDFG